MKRLEIAQSSDKKKTGYLVYVRPASKEEIEESRKHIAESMKLARERREEIERRNCIISQQEYSD